MQRILVTVDGSEHALRGVEYLARVIKEGALLGGPGEVHLINVQSRPSPAVARAFAAAELAAYYQEQYDSAHRAAEDLLRTAGVPFHRHDRQGSIAQTIVAVAQELHCDQIVMSTQGAGSLGGMLLGSVASKVIHLTNVPVTLVK